MTQADSGRDSAAGSTQEPAAVIARVAATLHSNGESSRVTAQVLHDLRREYGVNTLARLEWSGVTVYSFGQDGQTRYIVATPTNHHVGRVNAALQTIGRHHPELPSLDAEMKGAASLPVYPTWVFALACAVGATSLSLIFGEQHPASVVMVGAAAGLGGVLRRLLAPLFGSLLPIVAAAFLGGLAGALAVHLGISDSARLVALCPAMVMVPGPHILNGCLDLVDARADLAIARLANASTTLLAISAGTFGRLLAGGVALPVEGVTHAAQGYTDVLAAVAYSVFFSLPARFIPWAAGVSMVAHGLHWYVSATLGWPLPAAALIHCTTAGLFLTPICRHFASPS